MKKMTEEVFSFRFSVRISGSSVPRCFGIYTVGEDRIQYFRFGGGGEHYVNFRQGTRGHRTQGHRTQGHHTRNVPMRFFLI